MRQLALATAMTVIGTTALSETTYKGYEIPSYHVVQAQGAIELRDYAPHIVAEVSVPGARWQAANRGFRQLADYIFGGNASANKVAMTAPVTQTNQGSAWVVRFMMPSEHTLDTLPVPRNASVYLREVDPGRRLVLRFSGRALTKSMTPYTDQLQAYAAQSGLTLEGPAEFAYYDDPFTLPWTRRNEVSFAVK